MAHLDSQERPVIVKVTSEKMAKKVIGQNSTRQIRGLSMAVTIIALFQILQAQQLNKYYPSGRAPLLATTYVKLPFGAVKPQKWLDSQLVLQANGLTGHLDEIWSDVATPSGLPTSGKEYLYNYYEGLVPLSPATAQTVSSFTTQSDGALCVLSNGGRLMA